MFLIWMITGHVLGDFAFQNDWMSCGKGKSWEINFYHALTHTVTILVVVRLCDGQILSSSVFLTLLVSHFFIDPLKARWHIVKNIWEDQLLHLVVMILIWLCH